jgi:hypothetical protein
MHHLRLRAVRVAAGLSLAAGALLVGPVQSEASTWSILASPNSGTGDNQLNGVACVSSSFCTAVGFYYTSGGPAQTLIESWDGNSWSIVPSPSNGAESNFLNGVACVLPSSCTAVGSFYTSSGPAQTLIESWDGNSWSIVPSPNNGVGTESNFLDGVACVSPSSCTAVGSYSNASGELQTLIESWNGTSWSIVSSPNSGTGENFLAAVACVSPSSCTAAGGYHNNSTGFFQTIIESWDGTDWLIVSSPNRGTGDNFLYGVSCALPKTCTAVGTATGQTLIESLKGTRWSIASSPNSGTDDNQLRAVACVSLKSCTAAGAAGLQTLIESGKHDKWSIASSPNKTSFNVLGGVACVASGFCTAVGFYYNSSSGIFQTLIESE